jgi:hypothetical protein
LEKKTPILFNIFISFSRLNWVCYRISPNGSDWHTAQ